MARLRPGWLVVLCATVLLVTMWLPWLTTDGGARASAIGSKVGHIEYPPNGFGIGQLITLLTAALIVAGAMSARRLAARITSTAALAISVLIAVLSLWYFRLYAVTPIDAGYGFYLGVVVTIIAAILSVLAMVVAWAESARSRQPR